MEMSWWHSFGDLGIVGTTPKLTELPFRWYNLNEVNVSDLKALKRQWAICSTKLIIENWPRLCHFL